MLMSKQYTLSKVSLNRNTPKTGYVLTSCLKCCDQRLTEILYFPEEQWVSIHQHSVHCDFIKHNSHK